MRTILLGPQRFQVTAPAALRSLGVDGPVATINYSADLPLAQGVKFDI